MTKYVYDRMVTDADRYPYFTRMIDPEGNSFDIWLVACDVEFAEESNAQ